MFGSSIQVELSATIQFISIPCQHHVNPARFCHWTIRDHGPQVLGNQDELGDTNPKYIIYHISYQSNYIIIKSYQITSDQIISLSYHQNHILSNHIMSHHDSNHYHLSYHTIISSIISNHRNKYEYESYLNLYYQLFDVI